MSRFTTQPTPIFRRRGSIRTCQRPPLSLSHPIICNPPCFPLPFYSPAHNASFSHFYYLGYAISCLRYSYTLTLHPSSLRPPLPWPLRPPSFSTFPVKVQTNNGGGLEKKKKGLYGKGKGKKKRSKQPTVQLPFDSHPISGQHKVESGHIFPLPRGRCAFVSCKWPFQGHGKHNSFTPVARQPRRKQPKGSVS